MASAEHIDRTPPHGSDQPGGNAQFRIGRYELFDRIASGGMATVYFGRVVGGGGFRRAVALKRLHPHLATEKSFVAMLRDEARLAGRIRHPSVVPVLDVVEAEGEFLLVMELAFGPSLGALVAKLREKGEPMPLPIASAILRAALGGLGAAHDAKDESGAPLDLVHRDVSPQNVIVGADGLARVVDFGIAKARGRMHTTDDGRLKGNFAYMAPEQAKRKPVTRRADLYVVGILLWECVTGRRLHGEDDDAAAMLTRVLYEEPPAPSDFRDVSPEVDALLKRALAKDPDARFQTAGEMSDAIGAALGTASSDEVARFIATQMPDELAVLRARVERVENAASIDETTGKLPPASEHTPSESPARVTAVVHDVPVTTPPRTQWIVPAVILTVAAAAAGVFVSKRDVEQRSASHTETAAAATAAATEPSPSTPTPPAASGGSVAQPAAAEATSTSTSPSTEPKPAPRATKPAAHSRATKPQASAAPSAEPAPTTPRTPTGLEGIPRDRE